MKDKLHAYALCTVLLGAMLAPALRDADDDGFPFSTYPMFAHARGRTESVTSAVAVSADGAEVIVPAELISSSEPMQAIVTLKQSLSGGRKAAEALCRTLAQRVAGSADPALHGAQRVAIVTRKVDSIAFLGGQTSTSGGKVHVQCEVSR